MKRIITIVFQAVVSLCWGFVMAVVAFKLSNYEYAAVAGWFGGCLLGALMAGVFDGNTAKRAKHKSLSQGYREAA